MELMDKLKILTGAAKYDVACTSSGVDRPGSAGSIGRTASSIGSAAGKIGNTVAGGICHSFAADGRCISLLKILMTNYCAFDCKYCANRTSNDTPRTALSPEELAELTIAFYRRNYIEGLFLSSGILQTPDYTMERMIRALELLRRGHRFNGYIHAKAIPGASEPLLFRLGTLADRVSVNIELPSENSLKLLAPDKGRNSVLHPMGYIHNTIARAKNELALFRDAPHFAPAGQSTQMIIGASPDSDFQILRLAESLYRKYSLKRVFYSAYIPIGTHALLPAGQPPPLLREHRLYQSDWLLRFYGFKASEILDAEGQNLSLAVDPKCHWALNHMGTFPVEVNRADYELLLRVPGIGVTSARRIVSARRTAKLTFADLKRLGVVLKRAVYFITCCGKAAHGLALNEKQIYQNLAAGYRSEAFRLGDGTPATQLSFLPEADGVRALPEDIWARCGWDAAADCGSGAAMTGGGGLRLRENAAAYSALPAQPADCRAAPAPLSDAAAPTDEDARMSITGQL